MFMSGESRSISNSKGPVGPSSWPNWKFWNSLFIETDWYSNTFGGEVEALWTQRLGGLELASTMEGASPCADMGLVPLLSVNRMGLSLTSHVGMGLTTGSVPRSSKTG
jgi:hypothetical protein